MLLRSTQVILVIACCLFVAALPLSAQFGDIKRGVEKGVDATKDAGQKAVDVTKEGAQKAVDTTKEGVQKTKDAVTGEQTTTTTDTKRTDTTTTKRMKQTPSKSTSPTGSTEPSKETTTEGKLPRTAGETPVLILIGMLSLAAAGTARVMRRAR